MHNERYLFRGKRIDGHEWIEGDLLSVYNPKKPYILPKTALTVMEAVAVDYTTVGQFTGITDKNGVKVFDGDKVSYHGGDGIVYWDKNSAMFMINFPIHRSHWSFDGIEEPVEITGTIFDNDKAVNP